MEYPVFVTNTLSEFNLMKDIHLMIESLAITGVKRDRSRISAYPYRCFVHAIESEIVHIENFVHLTKMPVSAELIKNLISVLGEYNKKCAEYLDFYYTNTSSYFDDKEMVNVSCLWYDKYEPQCRRELLEIISRIEIIIKKLYPDGELPEDAYTRIFYSIIPLEE